MKQRVLHLLWDGGLGGVQRYVLKVVGAPFWDDTERGICFFREPGEVLGPDAIPGVPTWSLGITHGWRIDQALRLKKIVREFNPTVLHCHCDTPAMSLQIRSYKNQRKIFHEHGDTIMRTKRSWFTNCCWWFSGGAWDAILANSRFVRKDFLAHQPKLESICRVVHNPLIELRDAPRPAPNGRPPTVGVFGRFVTQKGIDWMLEVAAIVKRQIPDLRVDIFGDGPLRNELETKSRKMGLEKTVTFRGYVSDPLEQMANVDCVVVPSRIEPFGLVALEAQSVGTPVVGFFDCGVAEIVQDGRTGRLVAHGNLPEMAAAVSEILSNPTMGANMGICAKAHAISSFGLEGHVQELKKAYNMA